MFYRGLRPASSLAHRSLKIGSVYPKNLWASTSLQVQPRRWNSGAESPLDIPLGSVIDHITGKRIRVELEELQRSSISLEEYMTLARKNGLDEEDAKSLLKSLHDTGVVLYLPESKDQKLRNVVVIKTKNLTRAVAEFLELSMEDEVVKELERLKLQLEPMKKSIEAVERKASNYANLVTLSGFGLLVGQFTLFAHLTWGELSWDIMEPITYFAGQVNLILAYAYFIFVKREQTLTDVWETAANRRKSKLYRKMGIDPGFVFKLQESIQKREALLAHFGNNKPNTSTSKAS